MNEILAQIEKMSQEDIQKLLATEFSPELEKQASEELAKSELAEALYAYGAYTADRELAEAEVAEGELSKEASDEFDGAHAEITQAVETALEESAILDTEDTSELHKEAQAAAAIMLQGWTDQVEKVAAAGKKAAVMKVLGKHLKKHKGHAMAAGGGVAVGAAAEGARQYKKHHEKKASEVSLSELADVVREDLAVDAVIVAGLDKLAAAGKAKGLEAVKKGVVKAMHSAKGHGKAALKYMGKHKSHMGAAAGGAAVGAGAAHLAGKKD